MNDDLKKRIDYIIEGLEHGVICESKHSLIRLIFDLKTEVERQETVLSKIMSMFERRRGFSAEIDLVYEQLVVELSKIEQNREK